MEDISMCELCREAYEPTKTGALDGLKMLKKFKGYTVDVRLHQFRNINRNPMQFIEFTSTKGQKLLSEMHEEVMQQARTHLEELVKRLDTSFEKFLERVMQKKVTR